MGLTDPTYVVRVRTLISTRWPACAACACPHNLDRPCPVPDDIERYQRPKRKALTKDGAKKRVLKAKGPSYSRRGTKKQAPGRKRTGNVRKASKKPHKVAAARVSAFINHERFEALRVVRSASIDPDLAAGVAHAKAVFLAWLAIRLAQPDAAAPADWADIIEAEADHLRAALDAPPI